MIITYTKFNFNKKIILIVQNVNAVPICPMDPIVPIHTNQKSVDEITEELLTGFTKIYRIAGEEQVLSDVDIEEFCRLPLFFVHADNDPVCSTRSSMAYYNARKLLGAEQDKIMIFVQEYMGQFGLNYSYLLHFSWVPVLSDYSENMPIPWMLEQVRG